MRETLVKTNCCQEEAAPATRGVACGRDRVNPLMREALVKTNCQKEAAPVTRGVACGRERVNPFMREALVKTNCCQEEAAPVTRGVAGKGSIP